MRLKIERRKEVKRGICNGSRWGSFLGLKNTHLSRCIGNVIFIFLKPGFYDDFIPLNVIKFGILMYLTENLSGNS